MRRVIQDPVRCDQSTRTAITPLVMRRRHIGFALALVVAAGGTSTLAAADGAWSVEHPLSNCGFAPRASLARDGTSSVVFGTTNDCGGDEQTTLVSETRPVAGSWSAPVPLAESELPLDGPAPARSQSVANAAGERLVAWFSGGMVESAAFDPARGWGSVQELASGRRLIGGPVLAINESGDAVVVWVRSASGGSVVEATTRTPDGRWSRPQVVSGSPSAVSTFSVPPAVALDATGRAIAVWAVVPSSARNAFRSVFAAEHPRGAGSWTAATRLARSPGIASAQVGVDGAGTVVAAWSRSDTVVRTRPPGKPWTRPFVIRGLGMGYMAVGPLGDVVMSGGGQASNSGLNLTTHTPGGRWESQAIGINRDAGPVFVDGAGDALAVFSGPMSDTQWQFYASNDDAVPDRPTVRLLQPLGAGGPASAVRLRMRLSAAGRVLLQVTRANSRATIGAAMAAIGAHGSVITLPARLSSVMRRPGVYRLTADTGARSLGTRSLSLRIKAASPPLAQTRVGSSTNSHR